MDDGAEAAPTDLARPATRQGARRGRGGVMAATTRTTIEGRELSVSNLEKVLFPHSGFTKGQLIDYYVRVAPVMLPHIRERPLTMKRFPDGVESKFFFEKHIPSHAPDWVPSVDVPANDGKDVIPYAMVNDLPTLAWAANLGTIELHVPLWHVGRRRKLPARPDFMVFDLDPGEGTSIVECCEVAGYVTDELARQGRRVVCQDKRVERPAAVRRCRAKDDMGQLAGPESRDRPEIGGRTPGPRGLQHAQIAAPGPGPHRLESEPPGQDDGRRLLGPGDADADGVHAGRPRPRCGAARQSTILDFSDSRPMTSCGASTSTATCSHLSAWSDQKRGPFCAISPPGGENPHAQGKGCGGRRLVRRSGCRAPQRNDRGIRREESPTTNSARSPRRFRPPHGQRSELRRGRASDDDFGCRSLGHGPEDPLDRMSCRCACPLARLGAFFTPLIPAHGDGKPLAGECGAQPRAPARRRTRTSSTTSDVDASPPDRRSESRPPLRRAWPGGWPRRPRPRRRRPRRMVEHSGAGQQHRHRIGDVLAHEGRCRTVRCLCHGDDRTQLVIERQQDGLSPGDGAEQGQYEIREAVSVSIQGRDHERVGIRLGDQSRIRSVDQRGPVRHVGIPCRRGIHLLLQHPLVDRGDRPLRDLRTRTRPFARPSRTRTPRRSGTSNDRSARCARPARPRSPGRPSGAPPPRRRHRRPSSPPRSGGPPTPAGRRPVCADPSAQ